MKPLQLTDLPWEDVIYRYIFSQLTAADLWRFRGVCREFEALYCDYMQSCDKLDLSKMKMTNDIFQKMTKNCVNLQTLSLAYCSWVNDASLIKIFKANPRIKHVNISGCTSLVGAALQVLVVNCKTLETLILADTPWLTRGGWEVIILHQSSLQCLNVSGCWDVDDLLFHKFFTKFTGLKELHLAKVEPVTDETLCYLAHACHDLSYLDVSGCWRVTDRGLSKVVEYCPKLSVLNVRECRDVSVAYVGKVIVRGIWVISDYCLAQMMTRRKQANPLNLNVQI